jgi:hypothetical protein
MIDSLGNSAGANSKEAAGTRFSFDLFVQTLYLINP